MKRDGLYFIIFGTALLFAALFSFMFGISFQKSLSFLPFVVSFCFMIPGTILFIHGVKRYNP